MRGKLIKPASTDNVNGITPADAGKTTDEDVWEFLRQDHPRGCGENARMKLQSFLKTGSPPRMRGKRKDEITKFFEDRITPADAGKTQG